MAYYCDDVVVMKGGRVALSGTVSEVFSNHAALTDAGLDVPASLKIAEALSRSGISLSGELYTVSGLAALNTPIVGFILNDVQPKRGNKSYGYSYGYSSYERTAQ